MSVDLPIFTWLPQYGAEASVTPSVLTAQYGDGYSQDVAIGINSTPQQWTLTFNNQPTDADQIFQFLQNLGGVGRFWWTPPRQAFALKCKTIGAYKKTEADAGQVVISVTFQQVFDPS